MNYSPNLHHILYKLWLVAATKKKSSTDFKDLLPSVSLFPACFAGWMTIDAQLEHDLKLSVTLFVSAEGRRGGEQDLDKMMGEQLSGRSFLFHHH